MFLLFAHHLLLSAQPRFRALSDEELRDVIATAVKTLETTAKGILYSHKTSSPHLDALAEWLVGALSARDEITTAPPASDSDVRHVLEAIRDAVTDHTRSANPQIRYLETAQQVLQSSLREAPPIELPESMSDEPPPDLIVPP